MAATFLAFVKRYFIYYTHSYLICYPSTGEVYDLEGNVEIQIKGDWTSHFKYKHVDSETWTDVWNLETDILEEKKK